MTYTSRGLLCIVLMFTGMVNVVIGQDCDSFVCLKEFHVDMMATVNSTNTMCSINQVYLNCLREFTEICTSLTIQKMTDVATLLKKHACGSGSKKAGFIFTLITAIAVTVLKV